MLWPFGFPLVYCGVPTVHPESVNVIAIEVIVVKQFPEPFAVVNVSWFPTRCPVTLWFPQIGSLQVWRLL